MKIAASAAELVRAKYRGFLTFAVLLLVWDTVARRGLVPAESLPSPETIVAKFAELLRSGLLVKSLAASLVRILKGFLVGTTLGFVVGAVMGVSPTSERLFAPLLNGLRQVPIIGWIPLIIVWCGIADMSKITFIAIGAFFPMVINTFEAIRAVPHAFVEVARVFEYGRLKLLRRIVVPGALPGIATGVRLSLGTSWMLVVWSEINTRSDLGIGDMLWSARDASKMDTVIVCIIVIGIVAWLINDLLGRVETRLTAWRTTYR